MHRQQSETRNNTSKRELQSLDSAFNPKNDEMRTKNRWKKSSHNALVSPPIHTYGTVLHGSLKTRRIDIDNSQKFLFAFQSPWKLRYWRLVLTDEGLIFEKSRHADTKPYKGILLPFGKTSIWENWGKRGDSKYSFGFTLRVKSENIQMEAAVSSERTRRRWVNLLQCAFSTALENTTELVNYLAQKASDHLSKMTNAADEHCAIKLKKDTKKEKFKSSLSCSVDDSDQIGSDEFVRCDTIPRRYNSDSYDSFGHINDCCSVSVTHTRSFRCVSNSSVSIDEPGSKLEDKEHTAITCSSFNDNKLTKAIEPSFYENMARPFPCLIGDFNGNCDDQIIPKCNNLICYDDNYNAVDDKITTTPEGYPPSK